MLREFHARQSVLEKEREIVEQRSTYLKGDALEIARSTQVGSVRGWERHMLLLRTADTPRVTADPYAHLRRLPDKRSADVESQNIQRYAQALSHIVL